MFETYMKAGSYRVEYLNPERLGQPSALGFYLCGEMDAQAGYSRAARQKHLAGLLIIQRELGSQNLAAVYVDVLAWRSAPRRAFQQMLRDVRRGLFQRVFVASSCDLLHDMRNQVELCRLQEDVPGFELMTYDAGGCRRQPLTDVASESLPVVA